MTFLRNVSAFKQPQRGMASVLTMMLIGVSLAASVLGTAYLVSARQEQSISVHAQTQAQLNAWTGAQILENYFNDLQETGKLADFMALPTAQPITLQFQGEGVYGAVNAQISHMDVDAGLIVANIVAASAQDTRAQSGSVLEVIYEVKLPSSCQSVPLSAVFMRGNVSITGGESGFTTGASGALLDIVVDGNLSVKEASKANLSVCVKGDIFMDGGGIRAGGKVYSENGNIHFKQLTAPVRADVWGNSITMEIAGIGDFQAIRAGSYDVHLVDAQSALMVGQAFMGGRLRAETASGGPHLALGAIPWRSGTLIPHTQGLVVLTQPDKTQWLIDLSKLVIDAETGKVSNLRQAAKPMYAAPRQLPDTVFLYARGVERGSINIYEHKVDELWGYHVTLSGEHGVYGSTKAAGNLTLHSAKLGMVTGGGDFILNKDANAVLNQNISMDTSVIAGRVRLGNQQLVAGVDTLFPKLQQAVDAVSPGLPGRPYCETRAQPIDVTPFKSAANYIFEYVQGRPQVTVRGVKNRLTGKPMDGVYFLDKPSNVVDSLMNCNWQDNGSCVLSAEDIKHSKWTFTGIKKFPVGTLWFDGDVTFISATESGLTNTIVSLGDVVLSSHSSEQFRTLRAPGFMSEEKICHAQYVPQSLCEQASAGDFDALAKIAVITEKKMQANGWKIFGNLQLGDNLSNSDKGTMISGAVAIGLNATESTSIFTSGGISINTDSLTQEQLAQPHAQACTSQGSSAGEDSRVARVKWSRYL